MRHYTTEQRKRAAEKARQWNRDNAERRHLYDKKRRAERRTLLIKLLGGKCNCCGEDNPEQLDFDHINAKDKTIHISRRITISIDRLIKEIEKCQLLCIPCHKAKTIKNKEY